MPRIVEPWLTDWRGRWHGASPAMLQPDSHRGGRSDRRTGARSMAFALVPQGGNTSMVGGATPPADGSALILSLRRIEPIRTIEPGHRPSPKRE